MKNKKVLVGMSGGVDSSVTAYLLKKQGYDVIGATMKLWEGDSNMNTSCCSLSSVEDARRVANKLDIPYYVLNLKKVFDEKVIKYFISEYLEGRTPNPCIACNRYIKFEEFLNKALSMDIDYVATGHYARVVKKGNRYLLKKGKDKSKDQSYVLYNLTQEQLGKCIFPLGNLSKKKVRSIAKKIGLGVAEKKDSQEICFVEDNNYGRFVQENSKKEFKEGDIVDTKGNVLGKHEGTHNFTIGQRKGIKISSKEPLYVADIDVDSNRVIVGKESDIYNDDLEATDLNWIGIEKLDKEMRVEVKIRYGSNIAKAKIKPLDNGNVFVKFDKKQRAITSGQSVVFYKKDLVLGGGIIL
jgi:tRNA-specific 2-thiouridylase